MISGETPEGAGFITSDIKLANRLLKGGIRSVVAFGKMADSMSAAFTWAHESDMTENERQGVIDELYAYAEEQGLVAEDVEAIRRAAIELKEQD